MFNKFMNFCYSLDVDHAPLGTIVFVFTFAFTIIFTSVAVVLLVYNLSGAAEKNRLEEVACNKAGGEMIYVKGTGDVCISGIIPLK